MAYTVTLRDGAERLERTIRANNGDNARAAALELAAQLSRERGAAYRVARCDPA